MFKNKISPNKTSPNKVLLIATRQIGDVLLTPLLHSIRAAWPEAIIDVLVYTSKGGMLKGNTDCNNVIESDEHPNLAGYLALLKRIFRKYDLAINTQANDRSHQYALIASKKRVGLIPDLKVQSLWKRVLSNSWHLLDNVNTHTIVQNLALVESLNIEKLYEIIPPSNTQAATVLDKLLNFDWRNEKFVVIHPFPMWQYKRWTDAGWKALIEHLISNNMRIVLTGGSAHDELAYCNELASNDPKHIVSIAGKTGFENISKLLQHASAFIGPDTATTHLAAACGTPTLALYGPTNPVKWGPWPKGYAAEKSPWVMTAPYQRVNNVLLLQGLGNCVPCHEEGCNKHKNSESRCMNELPASRVITALEILLTK